jgi:hypothetical protein
VLAFSRVLLAAAPGGRWDALAEAETLRGGARAADVAVAHLPPLAALADARSAAPLTAVALSNAPAALARDAASGAALAPPLAAAGAAADGCAPPLPDAPAAAVAGGGSMAAAVLAAAARFAPNGFDGFPALAVARRGSTGGLALAAVEAVNADALGGGSPDGALLGPRLQWAATRGASTPGDAALTATGRAPCCRADADADAAGACSSFALCAALRADDGGAAWRVSGTAGDAALARPLTLFFNESGGLELGTVSSIALRWAIPPAA